MGFPIVPTNRITFHYTVNGYPHKRREYVAGFVGSSDPAFYDILSHGASGSVGASVAINQYWTRLDVAYSSPQTTFDVATLETLSGSAWNPVSTYQTSVVPSGSGSSIAGGQLTSTFYDTVFKKYRSIFLETIFPVGVKKNSLATAFLGTFMNELQNPSPTVPEQLGNWIISRSAHDIRSFVSQTTDLNDKIRRGRHIA